MEAVAKYAYTASSPTELSFNAGDNMKVIENNLWFLFIKKYIYKRLNRNAPYLILDT